MRTRICRNKISTHFQDIWELRKQIVYGFETWWSRFSNETRKTMLGGVYFLPTKQLGV